MFAKITNAMDFQAKALIVRADRQRVIASNIANADTPGFAGRDLDFHQAMQDALGSSGGTLGGKLTLARSTSLSDQNSSARENGTTHPAHFALQSTLGTLGGNGTDGPNLQYTTQSQPSMDGNSVDMDRERANFVDNAVHYEATLRFINGSSKTILSAIQGQ